MEQLFDLLQKHRSIRKYKTDPVPETTLQKILSSASRASSSGNMQAYSIIVTEDLRLRQQLFDAHFQQSMVVEAPLLLTFCADFHRMRQWLELRNAPANFDNFMSFLIGAIDAILASQNAALAAEAEGLGLCYLGTTLASCLDIAKILKCPPHVVPVVGFSCGYPDEAPEIRERLPLEGLVHRETYQTYSSDQIAQIYRQREQSGWDRYMNHPELREKVMALDVENLAQIYTKVKYTRESHLKYSTDVLRCLVEQNFLHEGILSSI